MPPSTILFVSEDTKQRKPIIEVIGVISRSNKRISQWRTHGMNNCFLFWNENSYEWVFRGQCTSTIPVSTFQIFDNPSQNLHNGNWESRGYGPAGVVIRWCNAVFTLTGSAKVKIVGKRKTRAKRPFAGLKRDEGRTWGMRRFTHSLNTWNNSSPRIYQRFLRVLVDLFLLLTILFTPETKLNRLWKFSRNILYLGDPPTYYLNCLLKKTFLYSSFHAKLNFCQLRKFLWNFMLVQNFYDFSMIHLIWK